MDWRSVGSFCSFYFLFYFLFILFSLNWINQSIYKKVPQILIAFWKYPPRVLLLLESFHCICGKISYNSSYRNTNPRFSDCHKPLDSKQVYNGIENLVCILFSWIHEHWGQMLVCFFIFHFIIIIIISTKMIVTEASYVSKLKIFLFLVYDSMVLCTLQFFHSFSFQRFEGLCSLKQWNFLFSS